MKRIGYWWFCVRLWFRERPDKIAWWVALHLPRRWALITFVRVFSAAGEDSGEAMRMYSRIYLRWQHCDGRPLPIDGNVWALGAAAINPPDLLDAAEMLFVVLANVSGGDWSKQSPEWRAAAERWRDYYFAAVRNVQHYQMARLSKQDADPILTAAAVAPFDKVLKDSAQPCGCDPGAKWVCEVHRANA